MNRKQPARLWRVLTIAAVVGLAGCATRPTSPSEQGSATDMGSAPSAGLASAQWTAGLADSVWPRRFVSSGVTNILYQPQIESWDGHNLVSRVAVALRPPSHPRYVYGVVTIQGITLVDKVNHTVALENIKVTKGSFPSEGDKNKEDLAFLKQSFPTEITGLSLERLESSVSVKAPTLQGSSQPLDNTPPKIIVTTRPAVLVYIDGPPVYRHVPGTKLERVLNTAMLLFKDETGEHYLRTVNGYLNAPGLAGPWKAARQLPPGTEEAERQLSASTAASEVEAPAPTAARQGKANTNATPVLVFVATTPTELLTFQGVPNFIAIAGTDLLYAANTTGNVFKLLSDHKVYVLLSGRWFRAPSLDGAWEYVPATRLASDFKRIPDTSPKENVKASVPGTPQATEALIANSIPQSSRVQRAVVMQDPGLDGAPQLKAIPGTPLFYVANSATPIIKVNESSWHACQNGVWFFSTSASGPWVVATTVPAVVYSIPPSSPLHYLTYVRIYGTAPDYVYEGYTPGYFGEEVEDGVVVYGTGYDYPPWVGDEWYGGPVTWGFGWGPCWNPWDDWCFGLGFGWGCGYGSYAWQYCHPPAPWWGPYRNWDRQPTELVPRRGETLTTARNFYRPQLSPFGMTSRAAVYREVGPEYGRAYNSRTGSLLLGQSGIAAEKPGRKTSGWLNSFPLRAPYSSAGSKTSTSAAYGSWRYESAVAPRYVPSSGFALPGHGSSGAAWGQMGAYGALHGSRSAGGRGFSGGFGSRGGGFSGGGHAGGGGFSGGGGGGHGGGGR